VIHEMGHWMGLLHTFGDTDCITDDGLMGTAWTSNKEFTPEGSGDVFSCEQKLCNSKTNERVMIKNWMSVSPPI